MAYSGTEQKDNSFYVQGGGKEIAIYPKKKECEHILTSASTSCETGGGRQWVGGLEGLTASLSTAGTSDN
jgi:hypothetical protein